jgi:lysophospholipase L1-like esterase
VGVVSNADPSSGGTTVRHRPIRALLASALVSAGLTTAVLVGPAGSGGAAATRVKPPLPYYLSLGDSYSVGYQPGIGATAGYTAVVAKKHKLQLENFGCGGATSSSILTAVGCLESGYGPVAATDAVPYPTTTQEQAAIDFIENPSNAGKVGLVTVSIGGNDITGCLGAGDTTAITDCVVANAATVKTNVTTLGTDLRSALDASGDSTATIVGLTYPDVVLGEWVNPGGSGGQGLANLSLTAFKDIINPDLDSAYTSAAVGGVFVDITNDTGAYGSMTHLVTLAPYGKIPGPVAKVCELTYFCTLQNIHANTTGYDLIGKFAAKAA